MRRGAGGRSVGEGNRGVGQPGERPAAITQSQHRVPAGCSTSGEARCCSAGPVIVGGDPAGSAGFRGLRAVVGSAGTGGCRSVTGDLSRCELAYRVSEFTQVGAAGSLPGRGGAAPDGARSDGSRCQLAYPVSELAPGSAVGSPRGPVVLLRIARGRWVPGAARLARHRRCRAGVGPRRTSRDGGAGRGDVGRVARGCVRPGGAGHAGHTDVPGWMACLAQILVRRPSVRRSPRPWPGRSTSPG